MKKIYIAAGGTGGHINAALVMGQTFLDEFDVEYLSGKRHLDYQLFTKVSVRHLDVRPFFTNPIKLMKSLIINFTICVKMIFLFLKNKPRFVLGCGGHICGPTLLAAKCVGVPIFIIEQNAIAGVTNKLLAYFSSIIFANFKNTKGFGRFQHKVLVLGNPIRKNIKQSENYVGDKLNIFVFGGSLGAKQINEAIQFLIKEKPITFFSIIHQVGKDNCEVYRDIHPFVEYTQKEYIDNMNEIYEWSNIIICRSGASSISELRIVKKPAILIPFPYATHNHQYYNALELKNENGFFVKVLDQKLNGMDLAQEIIAGINEIYNEKKYNRNTVEIVDSATLIKKEILKYVRNK